jgi:hypothetical protein
MFLAALAVYALSAPVSPQLNESDRIGNEAARLLLVVLAVVSGAALCAGYGFSILHRKSQTRSQAGIE